MNQRAFFREYCLQHFRELRHPRTSSVEPIEIPDLEATVDIFDSVLATGPSLPQFRALDAQFDSAFQAYLTLPRSAAGDLLNAVDRLANLIEPFLKKVAYHFLSGKTVTKKTPTGNREILLWKTSNYGDILEALNIISVSDLYRDQKAFWEAQQPEKAILREGFTARHKGTHESRIRTLAELETAAYNVLGQYIVVCHHLLHEPRVAEDVRTLTEKTRVLYLLRERVRTFPLTHELLSRREHLLIYKYREALAPVIQEKKYLFLNYLAERGPSCYWLAKDQKLLLEWAREQWKKASDEVSKRNAARYLLERAETIRLRDMAKVFAAYEDKTELARFMERCVRDRDREELLRMSMDRREEAALEARRLLPRVFRTVDEDIRRLARSKSERKLAALTAAIQGIVRPDQLKRYRRFEDAGDVETKVIYIYSLGEVGTDDDVECLCTLARKKRVRQEIRFAASYAAARLCTRLNRAGTVEWLLRSKNRTLFVPALKGVGRSALPPNLDGLAKLATRGEAARTEVGEVFLRAAQRGDRGLLREFLLRWGLDNTTRGAVLALCRVGRPSDCRFMLRLIGQTKGKIELYNHVRIAESVAAIAGRPLTKQLERWIKSPEFWEYVHPNDRRYGQRLPLENIENQALVRRVIGACFAKVAGRGALRLLRRLMSHNYLWIAKKAAERFVEVGRDEDLDSLVAELLRRKELNSREDLPLLYGLRALDERLYLSNK